MDDGIDGASSGIRVLASDAGVPTVLEVVDTGAGISEEDLERVFEPFQQVDGTLAREHDGTGLGLAISRHLGTLLGYELSVESKVNEGTTFKITLVMAVLDEHGPGQRA